MRTKILWICYFLLVFAETLTAQTPAITLKANEYSQGESVFPTEKYTEHGVKLVGIHYPSYCVYQIDLPPETKAIGAKIDFENPRQQQMDIFVWNYGTRTADSTLLKKELDPHWILWESTQRNADWTSGNPKYLILREDDGLLDFVSDTNTLKLLLYADGGMPPHSDELFYINEIKILLSPYNAILERVAANPNVWTENGKLIAKGIGQRIEEAENQGQVRADAVRAAKMDAMRHLAEAIYGTQVSDDKVTIVGKLQGFSQRSSRDLPDGGIEVILEIPLTNIEYLAERR